MDGLTRKQRGTINVVGDKIVVDCMFKFKDKVKSVNGARWDKKSKTWQFPATQATANEVGRILFFLEQDQTYIDYCRMGVDLAEVSKAKTNDDLPDVELSKTSAWNHQRQAFHFAKELDAVMLAMDMGTGKSKVTIDLINHANAKRVLIMCPLSVVDVWETEFNVHSHYDYECCLLFKGAVKKKQEQAEIAVARAGINGRLAIVINYESAWRPAFASWALKQKWDVVVMDESHKVKAPGGAASRFCGKLRTKAKKKIACTGTPMPHSPLDLYAQYRALDPGIFGTSFVRFRNKYAIMGGFQGHQILDFQNQEDLQERFYSIAYRADKSILDLPEFIDTYRHCELEPKTRKVYDSLNKEFIAKVESGEVTATNALVKLLRLQQVANGFVTVETPEGEEKLEDFSREKIKVLMECVDDIDKKEPIVVFALFRYDIKRIKEELEKTGRKVALLMGGVNEKAAFMSGEADSIVVQMQAGETGSNFTRARYCFYYSFGFSYGNYDQSRARIHRPGQTREVQYIHILAKNTVDKRVLQALRNKENVVKSILTEVVSG